ncbi:MAG: DNA polymerase III [Treponema sp.]|nr:DNA polymerase III [Treponema sp.]
MFENILGQSASDQLIHDITHNSLAPAMLFQGPQGSGKGSAALELSRVISCENDASWNCSCSSCVRHRFLLHPDLLCLGSRPFSAEITAASQVYIKEKGSGSSRTLFLRSIRKLLARFNPVLLEDETKSSKLSSLVLSLEEELDEMIAADTDYDDISAEKRITNILKDAYKLESEGISASIPIEQIRKATWWSRLAPTGKGKLLLIENAESMKEGARNSLLKLLEEPPETVTLVLTSSRPETLLPTMLSRLRPYRFNQRRKEIEKDIIRRVFHNENFSPKDTQALRSTGGLIKAYLDSFLPVSAETFKTLAAFFAASVSYKAALICKKQTRQDLPLELVLLGKYSTPLAEEAGLEKTREGKEAVAIVLEGANKFEIRSLFPRFINCLLIMITESLKTAPSHSSSVIGLMELWRKSTGEAETAAMVYNQSISLALDRLFISLSRGMAEL